ncbi:hypothetical protein LSH36_233g08164 [Paralvinella palmiformis]|uniref:SPRY domain-containing protein n=1 Tax=Paralvinella palmiformis TaxID=53620 RepID=A0AAD9JM29_9ANNE|nr:hypothetical protein LSH36_233g08164 [Paralvinella palmiformis]
MASCLCCLKCRWGQNSLSSGHVRLEDMPKVKLDTSFMGHDVVIVKSGRRICGTGAALSNAPIVQDKAYFEAKLQTTGVWGIGLANRQVNLSEVPLGKDKNSWVMNHNGVFLHDNEERGRLSLTYDHVELNFFINGKAQNIPFTGIKGTVFPVLYVDDGATLDVQFTGFYYPPPEGFEEIMIEKSLL